MTLNTQAILIGTRVTCFRDCPDYRTSKSLNIGPWFIYRITQDTSAYHSHPRVDTTPLRPMDCWTIYRPNYWTTELAYDYTGLQATLQDMSDFMTYFANHVRDALKFDY